MKRLIAHLTAKAAGIPSLDEYAKHNLALFLDANNIKEPELECYKIDRDQYRRHLFNRVYVGRAKHNDKLVALVVSYEEDSGFTRGETFDPKDAHRHKAVVTKYKATPSKYGSLFLAFSSEWGPELHQL